MDEVWCKWRVMDVRNMISILASHEARGQGSGMEADLVIHHVHLGPETLIPYSASTYEPYNFIRHPIYTAWKGVVSQYMEDEGIQYDTVWLEYPEIEGFSKQVGVSPTKYKPDGRPTYTLPMITIPRLGRLHFIASSREQASSLLLTILPNYALATAALLNPISEGFFRRNIEEMEGRKLEEMAPEASQEVQIWQTVRDALGKVDGWIKENGECSSYLMGDRIAFADIWIAAYLRWIQLVMPERWEEVKLWHDGRWAMLLDSMETCKAIL
ncbi:hypothetical protein C8J57DRAFT_1483295 [Mycena rebaudengoi]|nr:hypothetical protein C8J57DRAFT_1483295 [Mycena rebaudengoi]